MGNSGINNGPLALGALMAQHPWLIKAEGVENQKKNDAKKPGLIMDVKAYDLMDGMIFPPQVNEQFKEMVWAAQQKRIKDISVKRVLKDLRQLIQRAVSEVSVRRLGTVHHQDSVSELVHGVADFLYQDFKLLSIADLNVAFREGARGTYGECGKIYARTFHHWLRTYRQQRLAVLKVQKRYELDRSRAMEKPLPAPTEDALIQCLLREYREFEATGTFQVFDADHIRYVFLRSCGLLTFDAALEGRFLCKAAEELSDIKGENFIANHNSSDVEERAQDIALEHYFKQLKRCSADLGQLIMYHSNNTLNGRKLRNYFQELTIDFEFRSFPQKRNKERNRFY